MHIKYASLYATYELAAINDAATNAVHIWQQELQTTMIT